MSKRPKVCLKHDFSHSHSKDQESEGQEKQGTTRKPPVMLSGIFDIETGDSQKFTREPLKTSSLLATFASQLLLESRGFSFPSEFCGSSHFSYLSVLPIDGHTVELSSGCHYNIVRGNSISSSDTTRFRSQTCISSQAQTLLNVVKAAFPSNEGL